MKRPDLRAAALGVVLAAGLAGSAAATSFVRTAALLPESIGNFGSAVGVPLSAPVTLEVGDTLDMTFSFAPVTLTGDTFIWGLSFASDGGGEMGVSGTVEFLGASGDLVSGPIAISQNMAFAHIGTYMFPAQYRTGAGAITFSGIRQILTIDSGVMSDGSPFVRTFVNALVWTDGRTGGGGGGGTPVVPEPATWAMLIAGFGIVGGVLRRRRMLAA